MSTGAEAVSLSSPRILGGDFSRNVRLWFGLPADADAQSRRLSLEELIAPERWLPPRRSNPELRKALGVIHAQLGETRRLLALPKGGMTLRNAAGVRELRSLARQEPALMGIDAAWELAGALKRLNLRLGDEGYVGSRLDHEHSRERETGHWHGWEAHFDPRELARLLKVYRAGPPSQTAHVK